MDTSSTSEIRNHRLYIAYVWYETIPCHNTVGGILTLKDELVIISETKTLVWIRFEISQRWNSFTCFWPCFSNEVYIYVDHLERERNSFEGEEKSKQDVKNSFLRSLFEYCTTIEVVSFSSIVDFLDHMNVHL